MPHLSSNNLEAGHENDINNSIEEVITLKYLIFKIYLP